MCPKSVETQEMQIVAGQTFVVRDNSMLQDAGRNPRSVTQISALECPLRCKALQASEMDKDRSCQECDGWCRSGPVIVVQICSSYDVFVGYEYVL